MKKIENRLPQEIHNGIFIRSCFGAWKDGEHLQGRQGCFEFVKHEPASEEVL